MVQNAAPNLLMHANRFHCVTPCYLPPHAPTSHGGHPEGLVQKREGRIRPTHTSRILKEESKPARTLNVEGIRNHLMDNGGWGVGFLVGGGDM